MAYLATPFRAMGVHFGIKCRFYAKDGTGRSNHHKSQHNKGISHMILYRYGGQYVLGLWSTPWQVR